MASTSQRSFVSGELSPALYARSDQAKYASGLRTCRNLIVQRQGGADYRPGTEYIGALASTARLIPWVFNDAQTCLLVFTDGALAFVRDGAYIEDSGSPYTIATPYAAADLADLRFVQSADVTTLVHPSYAPRILERLGETDWTLTTITFEPQIGPPTGVTATAPSSTLAKYAIAGATNAAPIVIDSAVAGPLASGQVVTVEGVTGNTAANGTWGVTVIDSYHFSLNGSVGNGAYVTGGDWYIGAPVTLVYDVTAVNQAGVESLVGRVEVPAASSDVTPYTLTWAAPVGTNEKDTAVSYNIYKGIAASGTAADDVPAGFIGATGSLVFYDDWSVTPDLLNRAPVARNPFSGADNYPAAVGYWQERLILAGTNNNPETLYTSRSGDYYNFTISSPLQDDDAVTATLVSRKVNLIQHIVDAGMLLALTSGEEWVIKGDPADILRPTEVNAKNYGKHGVSGLAPIEIDQRLLYVQARQSKVRDVGLGPQVAYQGFVGRDMTIFANHLFDGYTLVDWCYAEEPHSIVWVVRDDGVLLSLTLVDDQQVLAWAHHDTLGTVENVCAIPEAGEDRVYLVVHRDGGRYLERMRSLFWTDILTDAAFVDSMLSYDGRNTDGTKTMTLTGGTSLTLTGGSTWAPPETLTLTASQAFFAETDVGTTLTVTDEDDNSYSLVIGAYVSPTVVTGIPTALVPVAMRAVTISQWRYDQLLTLTCSSSEFVSGDVGNQIFLYDADGNVLRFTIETYSSATAVTGFPEATVPTTLTGLATGVWSRAVDQVSGLSHLEGQDVAIFADGFVVSSPNNPTVATITVTSGVATLDKPYAVIFVGLPYIGDLETLDLDTAEGASLKVAKINITQVILIVNETRGMWIGPGEPEPPTIAPLVGLGTNLKEAKIRDAEGYDEPVDLLSGAFEMNTTGRWTNGGRTFIRQVDPVPMTILAIMPKGFIPPPR